MRDAAGKVGVLAETDRVQIPVPAGGHKSSATRRKRHAKVVAEAALTDGDKATRAVEEAGRVPEGLPVEWHAEIGAEPLLCYRSQADGAAEKALVDPHCATRQLEHVRRMLQARTSPGGGHQGGEQHQRTAPRLRSISSAQHQIRALLRPASTANEKICFHRLFSIDCSCCLIVLALLGTCLKLGTHVGSEWRLVLVRVLPR